MNDVMIDIETLGTTPDSVILSIAAVRFDRETGEIGSHFYERIDCLQAGRVTCDETYAWWLKQSNELFDEATSGKTPLKNALVFLKGFFQEGQVVWSQGIDFDFAILDQAFRQHDIKPPWKYNAKRDTRTVYEICDFDPRFIERQGDKHNALEDCHHQIKCVVAALRCVWVV
jgi:hypothetical protein